MNISVFFYALIFLLYNKNSWLYFSFHQNLIWYGYVWSLIYDNLRLFITYLFLFIFFNECFQFTLLVELCFHFHIWFALQLFKFRSDISTTCIFLHYIAIWRALILIEFWVAYYIWCAKWIFIQVLLSLLTRIMIQLWYHWNRKVIEDISIKFTVEHPLLKH